MFVGKSRSRLHKNVGTGPARMLRSCGIGSDIEHDEARVLLQERRRIMPPIDARKILSAYNADIGIRQQRIQPICMIGLDLLDPCAPMPDLIGGIDIVEGITRRGFQPDNSRAGLDEELCDESRRHARSDIDNEETGFCGHFGFL